MWKEKVKQVGGGRRASGGYGEYGLRVVWEVMGVTWCLDQVLVSRRTAPEFRTAWSLWRTEELMQTRREFHKSM